jgi:hypothetical protein
MDLVRSPSRRRLISAALSAALLHQLGACPCGCLERNLWWQSFIQLTGQARNQVDIASTVTTRFIVVDSSDCDEDHEQLVYLARPSAKMLESHLGHFYAFNAIAWHAIMPDQIALSTTSRVQVICRTFCSAAQTLRAQLQVFLI